MELHRLRDHRAHQAMIAQHRAGGIAQPGTAA